MRTRRTPRVCRCARPIPYREPGEEPGCAKCGHELADDEREDPDRRSDRTTATPAGEQQVVDVSSSAPLAPQPQDAAAPTGALPIADGGRRLDWPFSSWAAQQLGQRELPG